jgi:hypothetical protein
MGGDSQEMLRKLDQIIDLLGRISRDIETLRLRKR